MCTSPRPLLDGPLSDFSIDPSFNKEVLQEKGHAVILNDLIIDALKYEECISSEKTDKAGLIHTHATQKPMVW